MTNHKSRKQQPRKVYNFTCSPHKISLLFKLRPDFVIWKMVGNICTALWSFVNFCCLSQSEVSTDNRKVSTFFAFQHVRCRCCYRSYLDRFLNQKFFLCARRQFTMLLVERRKKCGNLKPKQSFIHSWYAFTDCFFFS